MLSFECLWSDKSLFFFVTHIPNHMILCHFTSYHIISHHIISYHVMSCHMISYHIILYHAQQTIWIFINNKSKYTCTASVRSTFDGRGQGGLFRPHRGPAPLTAPLHSCPKGIRSLPGQCKTEHYLLLLPLALHATLLDLNRSLSFFT